jgi:hypothetical protein
LAAGGVAVDARPKGLAEGVTLLVIVPKGLLTAGLLVILALRRCGQRFCGTRKYLAVPQGFDEAIAAVGCVEGANGDIIAAGALGAPKPPKADMMLAGGDAALESITWCWRCCQS